MFEPKTDHLPRAETLSLRPRFPKELLECAAAILAGAVLGLSAPGFNQWYLGWVALVPFFVLSSTAAGYGSAAMRGYLYGLAYNFVALSWLLQLSPPWWLGVQAPSHVASAAVLAWVNVCVIQGTVSLALACLTRAAFRWISFRPLLLLVLPLVWVVLSHYVFVNADLLLLSFSHLEYSQWMLQSLVQSASYIGGVGVEAIMVAFNLALCMLIATATRKSSWAPVAVSTLRLAGIQLAFVALLILSMVSFGSSQISGFQSEKMRIVSVVQLNLGAKFDHTGQKPDAREIWRQCKMAAQSCPRGLIVFSESILPEDALQVAGLRQEIQSFAREHGSDLIMGVWERTKDGQTYNSVISFPASERFRSQIYRKRYLMPVGEFEPFIMRFLGEGARRTLHFSLMPDIQRGVEPTSLPTASGAIGVLVCAENSQPALCAQSVGSDTNLIVNLGTLTWFEGSRLGDLSKASAIFRAVENRRSIVYASDTGPSFIVDPTGRILASSKWSEPAIIQAMVPLNNEVSATTSWFCRICGTQR